MVKKHMDIQV